jgi:DNA-binding response OmpR family regulator
MATVLLVESDRSALRALRRLLEAAGYEVCTATGLEEACRLASEHPCALAIVDISAPGVAGIALCGALHRRGSAAVLALSTGAVPGECAAAIAAGARECLMKPVPADRLLDCLSSLARDEKRPTSPGTGDAG